MARYAYITDNFTQMNGSAGVSDISAKWRMSFTMHKRFTLQPMLYGRLLFSDNIPLIYANHAGGPWFGHYVEQQMPFAGVGHMETFDPFFVAFQLMAQQRIGKNHYVALRGVAAQCAPRFGHLFTEKTLLGVQAGYCYRTILGPLSAYAGWSTKTHRPQFFLNLGYDF